MTTPTQKLADEFNRYFTSANSVDVPERVTVSRDEWRELYAAITAENAPTPPVVFSPWAQPNRDCIQCRGTGFTSPANRCICTYGRSPGIFNPPRPRL